MTFPDAHVEVLNASVINSTIAFVCSPVNKENLSVNLLEI
jgi:hypothetical protein